MTNTRWRKEGGPDGHLSVSWNRAEELVNDVRVRQGRSRMAPADDPRRWEREAHERADENP